MSIVQNAKRWAGNVPLRNLPSPLQICVYTRSHNVPYRNMPSPEYLCRHTSTAESTYNVPYRNMPSPQHLCRHTSTAETFHCKLYPWPTTCLYVYTRKQIVRSFSPLEAILAATHRRNAQSPFSLGARRLGSKHGACPFLLVSAESQQLVPLVIVEPCDCSPKTSQESCSTFHGHRLCLLKAFS